VARKAVAEELNRLPHMKRRDVLSLGFGATAALAMPPRRAFAQATGAPTIGILDTSQRGSYSDTVYWAAFRSQMTALGYSESNLRYEELWANGDLARLPELVKQLVNGGVRLIMARNTPAAMAARSVTKSVPIVVPLMADPVGVGLVQSLSHPGGNITGLSTISAELSAKRLELLREIVPALSRVAILWDATNPAFALSVRHTEEAAHKLGIALQVVGVRSGGGIDELLETVKKGRPQGLVVAIPAGAAQFGGNFTSVTTSIAQQGIPAVYAEKEYAQAGGLSSYGPSYVDLFRRAAIYADKVIKGGRPEDMPVEEPIKFEMVLNLKAAKALGITISPMLAVRADETVE
jgi:putative ABC transport system substrate-binding protein